MPSVIAVIDEGAETGSSRSRLPVLLRYLPLACDFGWKVFGGNWPSMTRTAGSYHPAIGLDQNAAMLELFDTAVMCRKQDYKTTTTQRQAKLERDRYLAKANELRGDAMVLGVLSLSQECRQKLADAAQVYRDHANKIYATKSAIASERKLDSRAHWVALTIGDTFSRLFGKSMYSSTATIASVVLDREVKSRTVQHWLQTGGLNASHSVICGI